MKSRTMILSALTVSILLTTSFSLLIISENDGETEQSMTLLGESDVFEGYTAITNVQELSNIRNNLSGKYYLANDIVFDEGDDAFQPIGNAPRSGRWFEGILDGNGHIIDGLHIIIDVGPDTVSSGLFGYIGNGAQIKNLGVVNSSSYAKSVSSVSTGSTIVHAGGIVGYAASSSSIINCYSTGLVTAYASSYTHTRAYAGGIVGYADFALTIINCYNTGTVSTSSIKMGFSFTAPESSAASGGIIGGGNSLAITDCYNTGDILASATANASAVSGGIIGGEIYASSSSVSNCYNVGSVSSSSTEDKQSMGGILGYANPNSVKITNCYYLGELSLCGYGSTIVDAGITMPERKGNNPDQKSNSAKVSSQMKPSLSDAKNNISIYFTGMTGEMSGWNFETIWTIKSNLNGGYPILQLLEDSIPEDIPVTEIEVMGAEGATAITTYGGKLQLFASVLPDDATFSTVTWSLVNGTRIAYIDSKGLLTAQTNGVVVVRATASDNSGIYGELTITISGQPDMPVIRVVTYNANGGYGATFAVNVNSGATCVAVSSTSFVAPSEKQFKEWNTQSDGKGTSYIPKQNIIVFDDMTLFAIWENVQQTPSNDNGLFDNSMIFVVIIMAIVGGGMLFFFFRKP